MVEAITKAYGSKLSQAVVSIVMARAAIYLVRLIRQALPGTVCCLLISSTLSACGTLSSTPSVSVVANSEFVMLPFENFSVTPKADVSLRRMVETRLRQSGVQHIQVMSESEPTSLKALLDTRQRVDGAVRRAAASGASYGVTGSVHEWQYNDGADREPVVGITLSLVDLVSGDVLWQGNAARSGWGSANLSATANRVVDELLGQLTFSNAQSRAVSNER